MAFLFVAIGSANWAISPGQFVRNGLGAKAAGYGNAYTAVVDDASAVYWNPAGLAHINGDRKAGKSVAKEAENVFGNSDFEDLIRQSGDSITVSKEEAKKDTLKPYRFEMQWVTSYSYLSENLHTGFVATAINLPKGTLGVGFYGTFLPQITTFNESGVAGNKKVYQSYAGYLGYGFSSGFNRIGFSINGIGQGMKNSWVSGAGLNIGIQSTPIPIITLAVDISNLIGVVQQSSHQKNKLRRLDTLLRAAISINSIPPNSNFKIVLGFTSNLSDTKKEPISLNFGVSYQVAKFLTLLVGYGNGSFSLGTELKFNAVTFAYAINQDKAGKDFQHFVDFTFRY